MKAVKPRHYNASVLPSLFVSRALPVFSGFREMSEVQLKDILENLELPNRPTTSVENFQRYYHLDVGNQVGCDQYLYLHPNGVCCVGVTKQHTLVQAGLAAREASKEGNAGDAGVTEVSVKVDFGTLAAQAPSNGKRRVGDMLLGYGGVLCNVTIGGQQFAVRSVLRRAKLMEVNTRLMEKPDMLIDRPHCEGHVATLFLSVDDIKRLKNNEKLVTPEEYARIRNIDILSLGLA